MNGTLQQEQMSQLIARAILVESIAARLGGENTCLNSGLVAEINALTSNATQYEKDICRDAWMDIFLTKTIDQTDLSHGVMQWVAKQPLIGITHNTPKLQPGNSPQRAP